MLLGYTREPRRFESPLDPEADWPGRFVNVRCCGGLCMVLLRYSAGLLIPGSIPSMVKATLDHLILKWLYLTATSKGMARTEINLVK